MTTRTRNSRIKDILGKDHASKKSFGAKAFSLEVHLGLALAEQVFNMIKKRKLTENEVAKKAGISLDDLESVLSYDPKGLDYMELLSKILCALDARVQTQIRDTKKREN